MRNFSKKPKKLTWTATEKALIIWAEKYQPPSEPFEIRPGALIYDPRFAFEQLKKDIMMSPGSAQAQAALGHLEDWWEWSFENE